MSIIKTDGYIKQRIRYVNPTTGDIYPWISLPVPYSDDSYFIISISNQVVSGATAFSAYAGSYNMTNSEHPQAKTNEGFFLKAASVTAAKQRECYTYGY